MSSCCLRCSAAARLDAACVGWEKLVFVLMGFQLTLKTQQLFFSPPIQKYIHKGQICNCFFRTREQDLWNQSSTAMKKYFVKWQSQKSQTQWFQHCWANLSFHKSFLLTVPEPAFVGRGFSQVAGVQQRWLFFDAFNLGLKAQSFQRITVVTVSLPVWPKFRKLHLNVSKAALWWESVHL